jgi:hypothetical protein
MGVSQLVLIGSNSIDSPAMRTSGYEGSKLIALSNFHMYSCAPRGMDTLQGQPQNRV